MHFKLRLHQPNWIIVAVVGVVVVLPPMRLSRFWIASVSQAIFLFIFMRTDVLHIMIGKHFGPTIRKHKYCKSKCNDQKNKMQIQKMKQNANK